MFNIRTLEERTFQKREDMEIIEKYYDAKDRKDLLTSQIMRELLFYGLTKKAETLYKVYEQEIDRSIPKMFTEQDRDESLLDLHKEFTKQKLYGEAYFAAYWLTRNTKNKDKLLLESGLKYCSKNVYEKNYKKAEHGLFNIRNYFSWNVYSKGFKEIISKTQKTELENLLKTIIYNTNQDIFSHSTNAIKDLDKNWYNSYKTARNSQRKNELGKYPSSWSQVPENIRSQVDWIGVLFREDTNEK